MRRLVYILSVLVGLALILWEIFGDHADRPWLFATAIFLLSGPFTAVIDRGTRPRPTGFPSALELARRKHLGGPLDEPDWPAFEAAVWTTLHMSEHRQASPPPYLGGYIKLPPQPVRPSPMVGEVAHRAHEPGYDPVLGQFRNPPPRPQPDLLQDVPE